jgi:putative thiamine transport system permease protein
MAACAWRATGAAAHTRVLLGPLAFGLAGTALPALGYLPELGGERFTTAAFFRPWRSARDHAFGGSVDLDRTGHHADFTRRRGGLCRQRSRDTATLLTHAADDIAASVSAPCRGGLRARLHDCAIGHADATDLAMGSQGSTGPPDLLIVNDPMALSMMAGLIVKEIPFLFLVTLAALPQTRHVRNHAARAFAGLWPDRQLSPFLLWPPLYRQIRLAVFAVVAYATVGGRRGADPWAAPATYTARAVDRLDERSGS